MSDQEIYQEVEQNSEGMGVTTYAEESDQPEVFVEDESWWTWIELGLLLEDQGFEVNPP